MSKLQVALTIAGTDPSGGAGIMADLKSFQARGVYGMAVVTSVVAQNTQGVQAICNLDQMILDEQLKSVFSDIKPDAIKTGMLAEVETIECVSQYLNTMSCPYVLDPVMVATSGDRLISQKAVEALKEKLLPLATIITPNLSEAEVLFGQELKDEDAIFKAGKSIQAKYGVKNVVIKGGHLQNEAKDFLFLEAAVITAELAKGRSVQEAVGTAKRFITEAIRTAPELGHGNGPVNHVTYKGD